MNFKNYLKTRFPFLHKMLAEIYQKTPFYDRALARVLKERARKEQDVLVDLFQGDFTIRQGPFQGMSYIPNACGSMILPKILGSYENALVPWIEDVLNADYETLIDVGCAEGYYAVGLAKKPRVKQVIAYDLNPEARRLTKNLAELNGVAARVVVKERCDWKELSTMIRGKTFILCDIEGAEQELLDPAQCPELKQCDLVVEMHDFLVPGITEEIQKRFEFTHNIEIIQEQPRKPEDYPLLRGLPQEEQNFILDEYRPPDMKWMKMTTNHLM